jgi:5-formyltetrahydrofolate cyclo-ligase
MKEPISVDDAENKKRLRASAAGRRRRAQSEAGPEAAILLADQFLRKVPRAPEAIIAGYWPIGTEIDVRPLLRRLIAADHRVVLPVVSVLGQPLKFHEWTPETLMRSSAHGIDVPPDDTPELAPNLVITPSLAFDPEGWRLGYGGGFYDRTLRRLRGLGDILAIGVGYAAQQVDKVAHNDLDEQLDWVITEEFATEIKRLG